MSTESMRERFDNSGIVCTGQCNGITHEPMIAHEATVETIWEYVKQEASRAVVEREKEILRSLEGITERYRSLMPDGKFPAVLFPHEISDDAKWRLYDMGVNAVRGFIRSTIITPSSKGEDNGK